MSYRHSPAEYAAMDAGKWRRRTGIDYSVVSGMEQKLE
jgi:hypothetical protein